MKNGKIKSAREISRIASRAHAAGLKVVTTNGSFDLLHVGHVRILERARKEGDLLVVLLNSDSSVMHLKGPARPILPQHERAEMLSAIQWVDYVVIFNEDTPLKLISKIKPDVHVKGGSWKTERVAAEQKLVKSWGGKRKSFPMIGNYSTTKLIERIKKRG
jgi:rfaE bifunctional protein nucleotidyltransferase chain/domain